MTWGSEEPSLATKTCDPTLEQLGIPALPAHSNNSGLDTADRVSTLLTDMGLTPGDVWHETIDATFKPNKFWRLRTTHGTNGVRLAGIDTTRREVVLAALCRRLATLHRSDYEFGGTLVCSISTKPTDEERP